MKNEPCIRLGMRIRPKISENPAESRNSNPPSAKLFTAKISQRLICATFVRWYQSAGPRSSAAEVLGWRVVSRVHGLRQELLLIVRPELADVRICLDHRVDELAVLALAVADEH